MKVGAGWLAPLAFSETGGKEEPLPLVPFGVQSGLP
jgi:hypothetical protein